MQGFKTCGELRLLAAAAAILLLHQPLSVLGVAMPSQDVVTSAVTSQTLSAMPPRPTSIELQISNISIHTGESTAFTITDTQNTVYRGICDLPSNFASNWLSNGSAPVELDAAENRGWQFVELNALQLRSPTTFQWSLLSWQTSQFQLPFSHTIKIIKSILNGSIVHFNCSDLSSKDTCTSWGSYTAEAYDTPAPAGWICDEQWPPPIWTPPCEDAGTYACINGSSFPQNDIIIEVQSFTALAPAG